MHSPNLLLLTRVRASAPRPCAAAPQVKVQRAWRMRNAIFEVFGHQLFVRRQDRPANFGHLRFPGRSEPSPFLVCSDKTTPARLLVSKGLHLA